MCFAVESLYSQTEFKEVKTAQDVIDNYFIALGGADKIANIRSESVSGTLKVQNFDGRFTSYKDDTMYVTKAEGNMNGQDMLMQKSVITNDHGWEYQMGAMKDFSGEELESKAENIITGSLKFYLDYKKYGYNIDLKGIDDVNGKDCYKVVVDKSGKELKTNYFDKETFYILKTEKPDSPTLEYDDFRNVEGIVRPFKITQISHATIDQLVNEYALNKPIDPELLIKPSNK